jgi:hypothetical protein
MKTLFAFTDRRRHEYKLVEVDEDRQNLLVGILYGPRHKISASATLSTTVLAFALGKRRIETLRAFF